VCLAFVTQSLLLAGVGFGKGGERVAGTCGKGATSSLKVAAKDGGLEIEFEVDHNRSRVPWRVVLVHDRRVVWRGTRTTGAPSGSFRLRRVVPDFAGADAISVRAYGPTGLICRASASVVAQAGR
jgi:hypothetical protein